MTVLELKSKKREVFGKKLKTLRKKGLIPAVVYGGGACMPLTLELKSFKKVFKNAGETTLVRLFIDNSTSAEASADAKAFADKSAGKEKFINVLIYDIDHNPITDEIRHVDFYEVKMDEKITTKVPLIFIGNSSAVSDLGGILVKAMQEIEIKALPSNLPHQIEIDISSLNTFEDNILIKDIKFPNNVEVMENLLTSIASVVPPRSEVELESLAGKVEEKIDDIAVETEEKAAERAKEAKEAVE